MQRYDVVIVGSGLGGLLCAYILGKEGMNVCVLEKNKQFGGCLQTFTRDGCVFDTGVHYIGSLEPGQILHRYFSYFGLMDKLNIRKLDEDGFDHVCFGNDGSEYPLAMGYHHFIETLHRYFPDEKKALRTYVSRLKHLARSFPLNNLREGKSLLSEADFFKDNTRNFLQSITQNTRLQNILAGTGFLYGGVGEKSPLYVHALINNSFIESSWRTVDGSSQMARLLIGGITSMGGTVRNSAEVVKLVSNNEGITQAVLSDGEQIAASNFISNIHPSVTLKMLNTKFIRKAYSERIDSLENTASAFIIYVCLKKDTFPKLGYNVYYYNHENVWDAVAYNPTLWPESYVLLTPENSIDDKYASSAIIMSYMQYSEVKQWESTTVGNRGESYLEFKKNKAELLLDLVEKKFPGFKRCISSYTTSSPLTIRDYTGSKEGSMFGILRNCNDPFRNMIFAKTKVPNLYFTGQNIVLHGILGVTIGAVATCGEMVGINHLISKINNEG